MPEIKARARNVPNYLDSPQLTDSCCDVETFTIKNNNTYFTKYYKFNTNSKFISLV